MDTDTDMGINFLTEKIFCLFFREYHVGANQKIFFGQKIFRKKIFR